MNETARLLQLENGVVAVKSPAEIESVMFNRELVAGVQFDLPAVIIHIFLFFKLQPKNSNWINSSTSIYRREKINSICGLFTILSILLKNTKMDNFLQFFSERNRSPQKAIIQIAISKWKSNTESNRTVNIQLAYEFTVSIIFNGWTKISGCQWWRNAILFPRWFSTNTRCHRTLFYSFKM